MAFIDEHRELFGVEPICRVLKEHGVKIAPSTFYAFKKRGHPTATTSVECPVWSNSPATLEVDPSLAQQLDACGPELAVSVSHDEHTLAAVVTHLFGNGDFHADAFTMRWVLNQFRTQQLARAKSRRKGRSLAPLDINGDLWHFGG